ncbi:MAG TPA: NirA family protein, partial [Kiritimatiellia bacterium]
QAAGGNLAEPAKTVFGTPIEDLCKEELIKLEQNPLDAWDTLVAHARDDKFPDAANTFRFKFFGLFYVAPAQDSFMLRTRIPGGVLTAVQLRGLADIAEDWGGGFADITTRANIQVRDIKPANIVRVLTKLYDLGLTARGSGADNIRNITASPTSGIDPFEVTDVLPYARALHHYILNHRDMYGLPRKFNIAFDNGGSISAAADTNDIGFIAVRVPTGKSVEPGTYFRVQLAGITGHQQFAKDAGIAIRPEDAVAVAAAMVRVFNEHGNRTNRKKARLKYLIDEWGIPKFIEETQKKLAFSLAQVPVADCEPRRPVIRHGHIGVYKQSQPSRNYVGVAIPVGRVKTRQMRQLADLAESAGSGNVRLTVFQNLLIPDVPDEAVDSVQSRLAFIGFSHTATSICGGVVACTGNTGCKFAATNTKGQALLLAQHLDARISLDLPINIHLTGCSHSCAQHYCGDIGLLGVKVGAEGGSVEGYNIVLGGGMDHEQALAKEVFWNIPFSDVPPLLERVLKTYQAKRNPGESFIEFTRRHDVKQLQDLFAEKAA